jgi:hypothetical protein
MPSTANPLVWTSALPSNDLLTVVTMSIILFNHPLPLTVLPLDFPIEPSRVGIVWLKDRTLIVR